MKIFDCKPCTYVDHDEDDAMVCQQFGTYIEHITNCPHKPTTSFYFQKKVDDHQETVWNLGNDHQLSIRHQEHPKYVIEHHHRDKLMQHQEFHTDKGLLNFIMNFVADLPAQGLSLAKKHTSLFLHGQTYRKKKYK